MQSVRQRSRILRRARQRLRDTIHGKRRQHPTAGSTLLAPVLRVRIRRLLLHRDFLRYHIWNDIWNGIRNNIWNDLRNDLGLRSHRTAGLRRAVGRSLCIAGGSFCVAGGRRRKLGERRRRLGGRWSNLGG